MLMGVGMLDVMRWMLFKNGSGRCVDNKRKKNGGVFAHRRRVFMLWTVTNKTTTRTSPRESNHRAYSPHNSPNVMQLKSGT
jgi:hypothetical protein